jgi:hypothetical protein
MAIGPEAVDRMAREEFVHAEIGRNSAFQARFLLGGEYLNPAKKINRDISDKELTISSGAYIPAERLSLLERTLAWRDTHENKHEDQLNSWADSVAQAFEKRKDFFDSEIGRRHKELYSKLGIEVDGFDQEKAKALYQRFFTKERKGREVSLFIADVLALDIYMDPSDSLAVNFARVKEDLEAYSWLGTMFGHGSSIVATELLAAEARIFDKSEEKEFIKEINSKSGKFLRKTRRVDDLVETEDALLSYVYNANQKGVLIIPELLKPFITQRIAEVPEGENILPPAPPEEEEGAHGVVAHGH